MSETGAERGGAQVKSDEWFRLRKRVYDASWLSWSVYLVPILLLLASLLVTSFQESEQIDKTTQWIILIALAAVAFFATLIVLARQSLIRRGYRVSALSIVIYLIAVRAAIAANLDYRTTGFFVVFIAAIAVVLILGALARRTESPRKGVPFVNLFENETLRPVLVALSLTDRIAPATLSQVTEIEKPEIEDALRELETNAYVKTRGQRTFEGFVTPTKYLRVAAGYDRKTWEGQLRAKLPDWMQG